MVLPLSQVSPVSGPKRRGHQYFPKVVVLLTVIQL